MSVQTPARVRFHLVFVLQSGGVLKGVSLFYGA